MKKILVIGSGGAGKSTFSRRLGKITGIEVVHLDKLYWKPDWIEPSKEDWRAVLVELSKADSWIMDGNYGGTMEMRVETCDTIILLDMPRLVCVYRILKRAFVYRNGTRPDMAEGCNEKLDWKFIKWIWNYPNHSKPKIEKLLENYESEKTIIRLKSKQAVETFLSNL